MNQRQQSVETKAKNQTQALELHVAEIEKQIIVAINSQHPDVEKITNLRKEQDRLIQQIAENLVSLNRMLFCAIGQEEFSNLKDEECPNFIKSTEAFNRFAFHVQLSILQHDSIEERILLIERWIKIMRYCYEQGDFNSLYAIDAGLNAVPIYTLYGTRHSLQNGLSPKDKEFFSNLGEIKKQMQTLDGIIPYLGTYRTNLLQFKLNIKNAENTITDLEEIKAILANLALAESKHNQPEVKNHLQILINKLKKLTSSNLPCNIQKIVENLSAIKEPITSKEITESLLGLNLESLIETLRNKSIAKYNTNFENIVSRLEKLKTQQKLLPIKNGITAYELNPEHYYFRPKRYPDTKLGREQARDNLLLQMKISREPKGIFSGNDLLQREMRLNSSHQRIEKKEYASFLLNDYLRRLVNEHHLQFIEPNDTNKILETINIINDTTKSNKFYSQEEFIKLLHMHFVIDNINNIDFKKFNQINKQIYYHQLILNPVLAEMLKQTYLKSRFHPLHSLSKTEKLIKRINKTLDNGHDESLAVLLKNIGFKATQEQLKQIIAENVRLRKEMLDENIVADEEEMKWLLFNKSLQPIAFHPYEVPFDQIEVILTQAEQQPKDSVDEIPVMVPKYVGFNYKKAQEIKDELLSGKDVKATIEEEPLIEADIHQVSMQSVNINNRVSTVQVNIKTINTVTICTRDEETQRTKSEFYFKDEDIAKIQNEERYKTAVTGITLPSLAVMEWAAKNVNLFLENMVNPNNPIKIYTELFPPACLEAMIIYLRFIGHAYRLDADLDHIVSNQQIDQFEKMWKQIYPNEVGRQEDKVEDLVISENIASELDVPAAAMNLEKQKVIDTPAESKKRVLENEDVEVKVVKQVDKSFQRISPYEQLALIKDAVRVAEKDSARQPMWNNMSAFNIGENNALEALKNNLRYYEKQKYPFPRFKSLFTKVKTSENTTQPVFYISYDGLPLTKNELDHMRKNALIVRRLSLIGGILNTLANYDKFLPAKIAKNKEGIQLYLIKLANQFNPSLKPEEKDINVWINEMIDHIASITGENSTEIRNLVSVAERYFVAEYKSQQILLNETTMNEKDNHATVVQMDIPYGNVLTDAQKETYFAIHAEPPASRPEWFKQLTAWEQAWLSEKVPTNIHDEAKWTEFGKLSKSSAMSHIPGVQNARMNHLFVKNSEIDPFILFSQSFKTGTMVPYEMPGDLITETGETAEQVLDYLKKHAKNNFDTIWGNFLPPDLKPLIFVQSLLSDTVFGGKDIKLSKLQQKAIQKLREENKSEFEIFSGNDPVNVLRLFAAQSGVVSRAIGRWDHTDAVLDYANKVITALEGKPLTKEQQDRLKLINIAVNELTKLRTNHNLPQLGRNFAAFKAAYTAILVEAMGGVVTTNCKSGKDRTGFEELYTNAMMLYYARNKQLPSYSDSTEAHKGFIKCYEILFNSRKVQEAAAGNTPGSFGMIDEAMMITYGDIYKELGDSYKVSDKLARYNKPKALKSTKEEEPNEEEPKEEEPNEVKLPKSPAAKKTGTKHSFWKSPFFSSLAQPSKAQDVPFTQLSAHDEMSKVIDRTGKVIATLEAAEITEKHIQSDLEQLQIFKKLLEKMPNDDTAQILIENINEIFAAADELVKQKDQNKILQALGETYTKYKNSEIPIEDWVLEREELVGMSVGSLIIDSCYQPHRLPKVLNVIAIGLHANNANALKACKLFQELVRNDSKIIESLRETFSDSMIDNLQKNLLQELKDFPQYIELAEDVVLQLPIERRMTT